MTEDSAEEKDLKQKEPQVDSQTSSTVKKRLVLTLVIVVVMAATAVASVYRQEIYVNIVRTVSNFLSGKADQQKRTDVSTQVQTLQPDPQEMIRDPGMAPPDPNRASIEQKSPTGLSLSAEVEKSVLEVNKPETSQTQGLPVSTTNSTAARDSISSENSRATEPPTVPERVIKAHDSKKPLEAVKPEKAANVKGSKQPEEQTARPDTLESKNQASSEQFQVPGSLKVRIENYSGSLTKWRLMIILDDSDLMAKIAKPWNPDRFVTAVSFVSKLSSHITSGSKLAVRDFSCVNQDEKKKAAPCLSRMLADWSEAPFSNLKDKLQGAKPGGSVNPCAAAAYSMKKDFLVSDALSPRLLLITAGAAKCNSKDVLKAAGAIGPSAKTPVDILAVGMSSKKKGAYSSLAKKTGGMFIQIDNPSDLDHTLNKYAKNLHVTTVDRIEVRGDKVVFHMNPDEDITLAPGVYTVVLPSVKGLAEFKRSVPNVRIKSGEATLMSIKLSKGKATVKIGPK